MNVARNISLALIVLLLGFACGSGTEKHRNSNDMAEEFSYLNSDKITVLYFHNKQRCATCMAVEDMTNEVVAGMDSTKINFICLNIGSKPSKELEYQFDIAGPTLLIMKQDKMINLTNSAYLFARIKPEQFKADLKSAIKDMDNGSIFE